MGQSIVRFQSKNSGDIQFGVLTTNQIAPIETTGTTLANLLTHDRPAISAAVASGQRVEMAEVELLSPITRPCRILCQGMNYADHRVEAGTAKTQKENLYFRKDDSSIASPFADITYPEDKQLFDYEVEMGIVIGKAITATTSIGPENAGEFVHGVVLCNEMSLRDVMFSQPFGQWFKAKSWRSSSPFGSVVYLFDTPEEADLINHLLIKLWVNGELRQNGQTANLITKPHQALSEISQWCDMAVGDVLLTGTPGGVSFRMPPAMPKTLEEFVEAQRKTGISWLKKGDVIRAELISEDGKMNLGVQENKIV